MNPPSEPNIGRFLCGALEEFVEADPGRQILDEARRLSEDGRHDDGYRLLRSGMRRLGRWRAEAASALVEIALRTREPRPRLSDEFAELVRLAKGSGNSLLPVLEVFELAGHEERKELLFDHVGPARDSGVADSLQAERLHAAAERGHWQAATASLVQIAGKVRQRCFALWETCWTLVFPEREPWGVSQLDGKVPLPETILQLLRPLLELKTARTAAARPGAALRLPRPAGPSVSLRPVLDSWCRPTCLLREMIVLWSETAMLVTGQKPPISQADIVARLTAAAESPTPTAGCRTLPREPFLRRRLDEAIRRLAEELLADLGRPPRPPAAPPPAPAETVAVPAGMLKGRAMGIPAFQIGEYLVTRARFAEFDPSVELRRGEEHRPMTSVNWFQARAFARRLGGRLPTACEWWWALKCGALPTTVAGTPLAGPGTDAQPPTAEWSRDWTLAGSEKVRLNHVGRTPTAATVGLTGEHGLPPLEKDPALGFRVVL
jgi:hypothetical protein